MMSTDKLFPPNKNRSVVSNSEFPDKRSSKHLVDAWYETFSCGSAAQRITALHIGYIMTHFCYRFNHQLNATLGVHICIAVEASLPRSPVHTFRDSFQVEHEIYAKLIVALNLLKLDIKRTYLSVEFLLAETDCDEQVEPRTSQHHLFWPTTFLRI